MTLGEKLTQLRKENNWTQEQLAELLGVSRQAVSRWESDLAYPETEKLIRLSDLYHCSLDYLLREQAEPLPPATPEPQAHCRTVSLEEARRFLEIKKRNALPTAIGVFLCIQSPVCLILLCALSELPGSRIPENVAAGLGLVVLLAMVAVAVALFQYTGKDPAEIEFLEKEPFAAAPGVRELAREEKEAQRTIRFVCNAIGVMLCILSPVPLFLGLMLGESDFLMVCMVCVLLLLVGIAVFLFILVGMLAENCDKLLQEGDYTPERKRSAPIAAIYWLTVTAIFLCRGFWTNQWDGFLWPVAAVVFTLVMVVYRAFWNKKAE